MQKVKMRCEKHPSTTSQTFHQRLLYNFPVSNMYMETPQSADLSRGSQGENKQINKYT